VSLRDSPRRFGSAPESTAQPFFQEVGYRDARHLERAADASLTGAFQMKSQHLRLFFGGTPAIRVRARTATTPTTPTTLTPTTLEALLARRALAVALELFPSTVLA